MICGRHKPFVLHTTEASMGSIDQVPTVKRLLQTSGGLVGKAEKWLLDTYICVQKITFPEISSEIEI